MAKEKEVYIPKTGLMGNATDYHVYCMTFLDRIKGFGIGFGLAFVVTFVFYRVIPFCLIVSVMAGIFAQKPYRNYLNAKRKERLLLQFKDMLEDLTTSYASGSNTTAAFQDCVNSLTNLYGTEASIVQEAQLIVSGLNNGLNIEDLLGDFAERSELEDVQSFADVFQIANRQGGNIRQIVADTRSVINDKIEMEMEITTLLTSGKNDINVMMVMPLVIVLVMGVDSSMSITSNTPLNVIVKSVCIGIFALAYMFGQKIMDVKM